MRTYLTSYASVCWCTIVLGHAGWSLAAPADYPIRPVPANVVQFTDTFWYPRLETNRTVTIPASFQKCEDTGRIENFKVAAGISDKKWVGIFGFNDSDVSKIAEGAAYSLMTHPDPKLAAYLDTIIADIAAAQEPDGYLETVWTARDRLDEPGKVICRPRKERWLGEVDSHELYNAGHMFEAAAAHYEATGKSNFLDVAKKNADLLASTFGPGKTEVPPGHPEVELGLVKLYRATGDKRYLDLANYFIDVRGTPTKDRPKLWGPYNQDHKPFREQDEAVGHAVRAVYLYAAATDVAALKNDKSLADAVDRLWDNVVGKKQYLTGGIGSKAQGEAFGKNYRAAQPHRLLRNLRRHRLLLLGRADVPAPRRREVHRRPRTHPLQQRARRRLARRHRILLPESARLPRRRRPQQMVRLLLLPDEHVPLHAVRARLHLRRPR